MSKTPKDPSKMSPQELWEYNVAREEDAEKQRQVIIDLAEEERAIELGLSATASGKRIKRHGSIRQDKNGDAAESVLKGASGIAFTAGEVIVDAMAAMNMAKKAIGKAQASSRAQLAKDFGKGTTSIASVKAHEEGPYVYDTLDVSPPVYEKLMKEAETVNKKLQELEGITDPVLREQERKKLDDYAAGLEMKLRPDRKFYVHDIHRALREEKRLNGRRRLNTDQQVYIWALKSELADLRGIKSKVGDVHNQDPREAISSGDHLKGPEPRPEPA